jgi:tetratricopeptide (TPR) repeat protein
MTATSASRDRLFARLLCANAEDRASGILTASRGKLKRLFCLSKGWIVFATSNLIEEQFIEYLVRTGAMSPRMRAEAVEESARVNKKPITYLITAGTPTKDALRRGMEGLIRELTTSTLEWPEGSYAFQEGLPQLDGEVTVRLPARSLVFAHAKRYPASLDALRIRIGPPDLRPVATAAAIADSEEMDPLGAYIVARCDGTVELAELVRGSPAEEEPTLRMLYSYLLAGLLEPEDREARRERERGGHDDVLSREECLGRLTMAAGQDYYGVLGVDRTARLKAIREAYYALARRYHPDRFRAGALSDLLPRFEDFFMSVTEAYNTLSDKERRVEYDEQLASAHASSDSKEADTGYLARQNFLRGRALAAQRKFTEAVTFLENAISLDPGQPDFHLELGLVLSRNPRHREDAERHLLQTIELKPTAVAAYVALGRMYQRANRVGRAARMAREALRWEPEHLEAGELLADVGNAPDEPDDLRQGVFGTS